MPIERKERMRGPLCPTFFWTCCTLFFGARNPRGAAGTKTRGAQAQCKTTALSDRTEIINISIIHLLSVLLLGKGNSGCAVPGFHPPSGGSKPQCTRSHSSPQKFGLSGRKSSHLRPILWWMGSSRPPEVSLAKKGVIF